MEPWHLAFTPGVRARDVVVGGEKVLADGRPASVAPLAWTAAAVVLTAQELSR
jgi:GH15 family glucan-1,4-alpha-glucosidase